MKRILSILCAVILAGIAYLAIEGKNMQIIKTEIEIDAPIQTVWDLVKDVQQWQHWSPTINASEGEAALDATMKITMMGKEAGKDGPTYQPKITQLDEPVMFKWRAHMMAGFIFTNEKIIELEQIDNITKVTHSETFSGLMAAAMRGQMDKGVPPMLDMMNQALKATAEGKED